MKINCHYSLDTNSFLHIVSAKDVSHLNWIVKRGELVPAGTLQKSSTVQLDEMCQIASI